MEFNPTQNVSAVKEFPRLTSVHEVRQFLGLTSYYRHFVKNFAKIAEPLHALTRKGAQFNLSEACETAFSMLKHFLISSPILCYPNFDKDFQLEADASIKGLGAVLSQKQTDGKYHPVAYASRSLSSQERNYFITELETLAVVWSVSHFKAYLYGHDVVVYSDHSAVKAVLETPNPSGKHARWWLKVFGSGLRSIRIVYKAGKDNTNDDALSRRPAGLAPLNAKVEQVQLASIQTTDLTVRDLLDMCPESSSVSIDSFQFNFAQEQRKDLDLSFMFNFLVNKQTTA